MSRSMYTSHLIVIFCDLHKWRNMRRRDPYLELRINCAKKFYLCLHCSSATSWVLFIFLLHTSLTSSKLATFVFLHFIRLSSFPKVIIWWWSEERNTGLWRSWRWNFDHTWFFSLRPSFIKRKSRSKHLMNQKNFHQLSELSIPWVSREY